ncbi:HD-GYP domain-containing protein [Candidatus Bipolaricaulota bacterium]|nr:HD-GYP domain-containing protein [Candidatus Bipolaricaulota bacterium]
MEVSRQRIEAGRHFYLYASDEWTGFELLYLLEGTLTIEPEEGAEPEEEAIVLKPGDHIHHNGLPRKIYFRVGEEAEFLMINSAPSFDLMQNRVKDMVAIARSVEQKDSMTEGHCDRLGRLAIRTGEHLGLLGQSLIDISFAAYLHDIGKVQVPAEILGKQGLLTDEEWEQMERHPDLGAEMLKEKAFLHGAAKIVKAHHERFDGSGYPRGLKGEEIPIGARIIAVVDTYDAITSIRPYQAAQVKEEALKELRNGAGTQFDPRVVDAFIEIIGSDDGE